MRKFKLIATASLILALTTTAGATTADPNASKLFPCDKVRFHAGFDGFEIDYGNVQLYDDLGNPIGIPIPVGQAGNISYVPGLFDPRAVPPAVPGLFVLYDVAGTVLADVDSTGASSMPNGANLGQTLARNTFTAFGVGAFKELSEPPGSTVAYPRMWPNQDSGPMTTQQLTFTADDLQLTINSPTAAQFDVLFKTIGGVANVGTGELTTLFVPETGVFEVVEDATDDVDTRAANIPATVTSPAGELPTAFFDRINQDYYDSGTGQDVFSYDETAAGTDAGESLVMVLTHVAGMQGNDVFNEDLRAPGTGPVNIVHPAFGALTVLNGGLTTFSSPEQSLFLTGGSWMDTVFDSDVGFAITSDVAFGPTLTKAGSTDPGVWPEDPDTFTFQTPLGGGPLLTGGHVIPEPLTVLGVFLGIGGLAGYVRKRRAN